ncbi:helix-turn-helix transcriptional regulator [Streptomyces sp. NPDC088116]|uniref:helix-turn-helix domain-containing protein n=1 Tax=Streptomyces sp. NPDC088116 TaxID=3365825 RepID=UPI00381D2E87
MTDRLNHRQLSCLALAANGRSDAEIGVVYGVGPHIISRHLGAAYRILGARNRAHAVALALCAGDLTTADIEQSTEVDTDTET